jgi:hypothetical protein
MKSKKNIIEISEKEIPSQDVIVDQPKQEQPEPEPTKQKKILSDAQLEALAKAREKAKQRKKELAELNAKSKGLKEEKLKLDAKEYDRIQKEKELLDETVKKIEVSNQPPPPKIIKKKVKKIIYESDEDEEEEQEEEVIIKKKKAPQPKQPSYSQLADMSVEQQIKNKLQQEKITCFFNQLTGKKF